MHRQPLKSVLAPRHRHAHPRPAELPPLGVRGSAPQPDELGVGQGATSRHSWRTGQPSQSHGGRSGPPRDHERSNAHTPYGLRPGATLAGAGSTRG